MQKQNLFSPNNNEPEPSAKGSPLMGWDLVMEGYQHIMRLMEDAVRLNEMAQKAGWKQAWNFSDTICKQGKVVIVTRPDISIEFVSENMYKMNGYLPSEVLGKSPRIFQGALTEVDTRKLIRDAIAARQPFATELNNYRKNGEMYRCNIEGYPVFNKSGTLVNFIAFETETDVA